jgi:hypothetical protein
LEERILRCTNDAGEFEGGEPVVGTVSGFGDGAVF